MKFDVVIVMGVSGCGKSTVGKTLAERMGWDFLDADDFHPVENIDKMKAGIPLDDADRFPWLEKLNRLVVDSISNGKNPVLACSALKQAYRTQLTAGGIRALIIHLNGSFEEIYSRIAARDHHFMPPALLRSQFETLETPTEAWTFDVTRSHEEIVEEIVSRLQIEMERDVPKINSK